MGKGNENACTNETNALKLTSTYFNLKHCG